MQCKRSTKEVTRTKIGGEQWKKKKAKERSFVSTYPMSSLYVLDMITLPLASRKYSASKAEDAIATKEK